MKTILLTGSTGFLGKYVVSKLLKGNYKLRCLVRKSSDISHLKDKKIEIVYGDVTDASSLKGVMDGVDIVVHMAAIIGSPKLSMDVNYKGTRNLVAATDFSKIERFVFVSSFMAAECFGSYGVSKRKCELFLKGHPNVQIIRPGLIYGKGGPVVEGIKGQLSRGKFVLVIGDGDYKIQPIYVGDVANAIVSMIRKPVKSEILDLADNEIKYDKFVDEIMEISGKRKRKMHVPFFVFYAMGTVMQTVMPRPPVNTESLRTMHTKRNICSKKCLSELGIKLTPLKEGLKKSLL